jgi:hypothetical protein
MTKICIHCGHEKDINDFYKHPAMADGHLGRCKICQQENSKENYRKNIGHRIAYEAERAKRPGRKARAAQYLKRARMEKTAQIKARQAVANAVRDNKLHKRPCKRCGSEKAEAHHPDYSKPLEVEWLCRPCHLVDHGKNSYELMRAQA